MAYYVQSVLFKKPEYSKNKAEDWLHKNKFINNGVDNKKNFLRYRQIDPEYLRINGYTRIVTKRLNNNVYLVLAYHY